MAPKFAGQPRCIRPTAQDREPGQAAVPRLSMQNGDQVFDFRLQQRKTYFVGKLTHEWRPTGGDQLAVMGWLGAVPGTDRSVRSASLQDREVSPLPV